MDLTIQTIESKLKAHTPVVHPVNANTRQAAVAAILREAEDSTDALFILRAIQHGDPWSGHMAFPGGHMDEDDRDLEETAARETFEEIGLDLGVNARLLGPIDHVKANPRGTTLDMIVAPYVYVLERETEFKLNHEVADVLWGSLNDMHAGTSIASKEFHVRGETQEFTGYGVAGQIVWGLTYRMLDQFFAMLDPDWVPRS